MGKIWIASVLVLLSAFSMAASSPEAAAGGVGKAIGMALFGFIVMKFMNRKKNDDEEQSASASRSGGGGAMSLIKVGLILIVGLFVLSSLLPK